MNIPIFGARKSFDSKNAAHWCKEQHIPDPSIDLPTKRLSPRESQSVKRKVDWDAWVHLGHQAYEDLNIDDLPPEIQEKLRLEHPEGFRAPIICRGNGVPAGDDSEIGSIRT